MNRARLLAIGKLLILLGIPTALVGGLFGAGVHYGVSHRAGILGFERDVLGLDVEVPADPPAPTATPSAPPATPAPTPATPAPTPATPAPTPATPAPTPAAPAPTPTEVPVAVAPAEPLAGDLASRLAMPVRVRVKVVVDDDLIATRPDWIDYVQRTVAAASQTYEQQFGITLELGGVARWPVVTAGLSADQLLDELRTRSREGSDVLVGMTARPLDGTISGQAETPSPESAFNGAYGIVYAVPGAREPHLRTLLHELAHMFGAQDVTDPADPAWGAASWMSYAPVRDGQAPWIDAANRRRVLERKDRPFVPEPGPSDAPASDLTNPTL